MKPKLSCLFMLPFVSLFASYSAYASEDNTVAIIQDIELENLSLKSTASEIEAFLASYPSLQCQRVDVPERKSVVKSRPPKPRQQNWNCMYSEQIKSQILNVRMSGGVVTFLRYEKRDQESDFFEEAKAYIGDVNKKLEASGLVETQTNSPDFMTYDAKDIEGGSAPVFMQQLNARKKAMCNDLPVTFSVSLNTNSMPSQNVYSVGMKLERSPTPLDCKN
ncbi:hypothetical protein WH95_05765 [Kiloniella litopenaei]|uniref:Uncharacterized protein n=1 Tax=Kiloniella litopenaei TaxID=1549748 RepID=A0A0M2RBX1_9PROT|nr:hypothetical protein [Kiloniella litopenaei]KKJ77924.1 hypothetical protein WH95_05765 [Kiloniella litopenaei]